MWFKKKKKQIDTRNTTHFNFIASNEFGNSDFNDVGSLVDNFPNFQPITLDKEEQFILLLNLIDVEDEPIIINNSDDFEKYWDLSNHKLPEFSKDELDAFYFNWLDKTGRENTMDEFGQLLFLHGLTKEWNQMKYKFVVKEKKEHI